MIDEKFIFTSKAKKNIALVAIGGLVAAVLGIILLITTPTHHEEGSHATKSIHEQVDQHNLGHEKNENAQEKVAHEAHEESHTASWVKHLWANLWINNIYFTGLAIIGVFFFAIQYVAQAGWSAPILRVPMAFGNWLPFAGILMLIVFLLGNHDLFHWTHSYLYDVNDPRYDEIIAGKEAYLNFGFYLARMIAYFLIWYLLFRLMKKEALAEDLDGRTTHWKKIVKYSAIFLIFFAVTSSTSAWDWVLSIDTHWFSTMLGWYVFASWFVTGLAAMTLVVVLLKEKGYLTIINANHLHDLGKFIFAFSIFWMYIWFSQFMLIYYANIPEETAYFVERLASDHYGPVLFLNLILNFFFPFLVLMTRDAKRYTTFLKIACIVVLIGHWFDFYLMVTPGVLREQGGFGFLEIGIALIYGAAFIFVMLKNLAKAPLVAKNHPMLEESKFHHI